VPIHLAIGVAVAAPAAPASAAVRAGASMSRFTGVQKTSVEPMAQRGVSRRSFPARALAEFEASYPNVRDGCDAVARDWGVTGLPETFFVDRRGRVVAHVIGAIASDQLQDGVRAAIRGRPIGARQGGDRRSTR
jgi:hypothetical protein